MTFPFTDKVDNSVSATGCFKPKQNVYGKNAQEERSITPAANWESLPGMDQSSIRMGCLGNTTRQCGTNPSTSQSDR